MERIAGQGQPLLGMAEPGCMGTDRQVDDLDEVDPDPDAMALYLGDDRFGGVLERHDIAAELAVDRQPCPLAEPRRFYAGSAGCMAVSPGDVVEIVADTE